MKPIFRKTEIVVKDDYEENKKSKKFNPGESEKIKAEILFIGIKCELGFEVGDTILFYRDKANKLEIDGEHYLIMTEAMVICELKESRKFFGFEF
jgi:co-chaperonin GroES (HSP10)